MATVDYDKISAKDKEALINRYVRSFNEAFKGIGTKTGLADDLIEELRAIGSSDLINDINQKYKDEHGETLKKLL